jgi:hypothetical protein
VRYYLQTALKPDIVRLNQAIVTHGKLPTKYLTLYQRICPARPPRLFFRFGATVLLMTRSCASQSYLTTVSPSSSLRWTRTVVNEGLQWIKSRLRKVRTTYLSWGIDVPRARQYEVIYFSSIVLRWPPCTSRCPTRLRMSIRCLFACRDLCGWTLSQRTCPEEASPGNRVYQDERWRQGIQLYAKSSNSSRLTSRRCQEAELWRAAGERCSIRAC